jgi:bifunctional DNA-binding transcriptional regulator/antitoxin component of YhaV-PrlF toxin-antitoxin module
MSELKEIPMKGKIRKISRAYYILVPVEIISELDIKENDRPVILLDKKNKILAFKFNQ